MNALTKYADWRQWLRGLMKNAVHSGTGTVITTFGTNGAEQLAPEMLKGIGLNMEQAISVFAVSAIYAAVKFVHESTEATTQPFPPTQP